MNKNEMITFEKYRKRGILLNKKGWPDHYYFSDGKLSVVETKAPGDDLSFEQQAVRDFLIAHGVRYIVELVKDGKSVTVYDSLVHANQHQAKLGQTTPRHATPRHATPIHAMPDQTHLTHPTPTHATPHQPILNQPTPIRAEPIQPNLDYAELGSKRVSNPPFPPKTFNYFIKTCVTLWENKRAESLDLRWVILGT